MNSASNTMKKFLIILTAIFIISLGLTGFVLAANPSPTLYVRQLSGIPGLSGSESNIGLAVGYLYKIALSLVGLVAFGSLVYAGILRTWGAVGNPGLIKEADERIKDTLWGIVLLLGAVVIFNTINPRINEVGKVGEEISKDMPVVKTPATTTSLFVTDFYGGAVYFDADARSRLQSFGIGVKDPCPSGVSTGCVSLNGLQVDTVAELISLSTKVGGNNVYVTGGTEGAGTIHKDGTYDHGGGYKFDLRPNTNLTGYITRNYTYIGDRRDGAPQYRAPSGAIYALEKDHWDVLVSPVGWMPGA